jgi:hypothetical protein
MVARADAAGLLRKDVEVVITTMILAGALEDQNGVVTYRQGKKWVGGPCDPIGQPLARPMLGKMIPLVRDLIARRTDARAHTAEPLPAFEEKLAALGHGNFRIWWRLMVSEQSRTDPQLTPTSSVVLSAALCEAALIFVVDRAKLRGTSMQSKEFEKPPRQWRMDEIVRAARNGQDPILKSNVADRCLELSRMRQRLHVSRLIDPTDNPPRPDTRPEEAREARAVAELVVRQILEWLERNPG